MRRICSTLRPQIDHKSYADWIPNSNQKLCVSSRGLIAFTSSFCLNQRRPSSASYHIYIADINTPYKPYFLLESEHQFSIIEWDTTGTKLLVCDSRGCASIYTSKDYLASNWRLYFKYVSPSETFVAASWYHTGITSTINVLNQNLKSPANHLEYTEKIQQTKFGASLRMFGGKSAEGCILISRTGLVCSLTLMAIDGSVEVVTESLAPLRTRVEVADISHSKDGSFIVGTASGSINSTISFYQIYLSAKSIVLEEVDLNNSYETKRVNISCRQFNSFHLNIVAQMLNDRENATSAFEKVSHIKFVTKDSPDDVLIEVSGQNLSLIELWELEPKKTKNPVHGAILDSISTKDTSSSSSETKPHQTNESNIKRETNDEQKQNSGIENGVSATNEWVFKGNYITDKDLTAIKTPKFKIFGSNRQLNIILLAYKDCTICCLRKDDLQLLHEPIDLSTLPTGSTIGSRLSSNDNDISPFKVYQNNQQLSSYNSCNMMMDNKSISPDKKLVQRSSVGNNHLDLHITDIQFTNNQAAFVAIDTLSQLHVVRSPFSISCQDKQDEETYLQYLLEYCLITGSDWWDAIVSARQESIESICDKFHDAYERQPKHVQKKYFNRQLMIRASLYRCLNTPSSLCKASDCHTMIMLSSIANTLKCLLRSTSQDTNNLSQDSPGEMLSSFLKTQGTQANFFHYNNVISKLNEKDFQVEANLVQCLQPLSQWVTDLAIFLVASTQQRLRSGMIFPGAGLAKNREAVEMIRELLIIIKIWGSHNEACLPQVHKLNDQLDGLGSIFRLISILYSTLINDQQQQPDISTDAFIEECIQLSNSISVPQFSFMLSAIGIASPLLHNYRQSSQVLSANQQMHQVVPDGHHLLVLEFFKEPILPELTNLVRVEGSINMSGDRRMDVVRNVSLGAHPVAGVRHCTRCHSISHLRPSTLFTRMWEQRWITSCVCGGSWVMSDGCSLVSKAQPGYLAYLYNSANVHLGSGGGVSNNATGVASAGGGGGVAITVGGGGGGGQAHQVIR